MAWLYSFLIKSMNWIIRGLGAVLNVILGLLPNSPFQSVLENQTLSKYVGYINYFIPVSTMVVILEAWVGAIAVWYIYQAVARWIKLID